MPLRATGTLGSPRPPRPPRPPLRDLAALVGVELSTPRPTDRHFAQLALRVTTAPARQRPSARSLVGAADESVASTTLRAPHAWRADQRSAKPTAALRERGPETRVDDARDVRGIHG